MKLFVGRLPYEVTEERLKEMFENIGEVLSAKVVMDRYSGRSRGFGFVEMANQEDGKKAIEELDGAKEMGRAIVVKKANATTERPSQSRPPQGRPSRRY